MNRRTLTAIRFIATLIVGYSAQSLANQAGPGPDPQYFLAGMRCVGGSYGLRLPATLPALNTMAPLVSTLILEVEKHEGYTATRKVLRFKGLTLGVVTFSNDPTRYALDSAEISSSAWRNIAPFRVGQRIEAAHKLLGVIADPDLYLRSTYTGEAESVRFESRSGRITSVIYECYTG